MAKLTAWLVLLLGILLVLAAPGIAVIKLTADWAQWALAIIVLVIGIGKMMRNYSNKKRR